MPIFRAFAFPLAAAAVIIPVARAGSACGWATGATGPSSAFGFGFAYDQASQEAVLFGGRNAGGVWQDETWTYGAAGWTQRMVSGPPALVIPTMTYDGAREECVLFGGYESGAILPYDGTWTWDGSAWTQRNGPGPTPRAWHAMACDAARSEVVLFGGWDDKNDLNDTWIWNGANWTQRNPAFRPSPRDGAAMVYHEGIQQIMMFGGFGFPTPNAPLDETWLWDGANWSRLEIPGPPARAYHQMSYDADRDLILLWGGYAPNGSYLDDTWQFDGAQWTQLNAPGAGPINAEYGLVYDSARRRHVLRGRSPAGAALWELSFDEVEVTSAPQPTIVAEGAPAMLTVGVANAAGLAFQWLRDGAPLADAPGVSGSQTPSLTLAAAARADTGHYTVRISDACGTVALSAVLAVLCPGDANGDIQSNFADLNLVISNFNTSCAP